MEIRVYGTKTKLKMRRIKHDERNVHELGRSTCANEKAL